MAELTAERVAGAELVLPPAEASEEPAGETQAAKEKTDNEDTSVKAAVPSTPSQPHGADESGEKAAVPSTPSQPRGADESGEKEATQVHLEEGASFERQSSETNKLLTPTSSRGPGRCTGVDSSHLGAPRRSMLERRSSRFFSRDMSGTPRFSRAGTPRGRVSRFLKADRDQIVANSVEVAQVDEGESFGELALQSENPRNASVRSKGEVFLATLYRDDYRAILQQTVERRKRLRMEFLQSLPWFGNLSEVAMERISAMLVEKDVSKGDRLCQIGTPARYVIFVMSGTFGIFTIAETWEDPTKVSEKERMVRVALAEAPAIFGLASYLRKERTHHIDVKCESMKGRVWLVPAKELVMHFPPKLRTQVEIQALRQEKFYATRATVLSQVGSSRAVRRKWLPKSARGWEEHLSVRRGEHDSVFDVYTLSGRRRVIERALTFNYVKTQDGLEETEEMVEEEQATGDPAPKEAPQQAMRSINEITLGPQWSIEPEVARKVFEDRSSSSDEEHTTMVRPWVRKRKKKRGGLKFESSSPRKHIKGSHFGGQGIWTGQVSRHGRLLPAQTDEHLSEESFRKSRIAFAFEQSAFHTVKPARLPHSTDANLVPIPPVGAPSAEKPERLRRSPRRAPSQAAEEGFGRSIAGSALGSSSASTPRPPRLDSRAESSASVPEPRSPWSARRTASPASPLSPSATAASADVASGTTSVDSPRTARQRVRTTFMRFPTSPMEAAAAEDTNVVQEQQQSQEQQQQQQQRRPQLRRNATLPVLNGKPSCKGFSSDGWGNCEEQQEEDEEEQGVKADGESLATGAEGEDTEVRSRPSSVQRQCSFGDAGEARGSVTPGAAGCSDVSVELSSPLPPAVTSPAWRHRVQRLLLPALAPTDPLKQLKPLKPRAPCADADAATTAGPLTPASRVDGAFARTISGCSAGVGERSAEMWLSGEAGSLMGYEDFASGFFSENVLATMVGASKPPSVPRQPPPPKKTLSGALLNQSRVTVEVRHVYRPKRHFPGAMHM